MNWVAPLFLSLCFGIVFLSGIFLARWIARGDTPRPGYMERRPEPEDRLNIERYTSEAWQERCERSLRRSQARRGLNLNKEKDG